MTVNIPITNLINFVETFRNKDGNFPAIKISIMLHLHKNKTCLVQEIADLMETSRPSAQRHLTSLVVAGMVDKEEVYEDGKYKNKFTLTLTGKALIAESLKAIQ